MRVSSRELLPHAGGGETGGYLAWTYITSRAEQIFSLALRAISFVRWAPGEGGGGRERFRQTEMGVALLPSFEGKKKREKEVLKVAGGSETAVARFPRALLRSDGKLWKKFSLTGYTREAVCLPFATFERESR